MFEENKEPVTPVTENIEETIEETNVLPQNAENEAETPVNEAETGAVEPVKTFTKEEVDDILAKKIARKEDKIRREYEKKYNRLETVVNTGLGTSNTEEAVQKLTEFYKSKGIDIPTEAKYSDRELEVLANYDAEDIISDGYDEVVKEVDRLANIGVDNMTPRDKIIFTKLATKRQELEDEKSLASIGVDRKAIEDTEFKVFAEKLNPNLSLKEKYEMYLQIKPKKKIEPIGSMKNDNSDNKGVKDYYSFEEASKFTRKDYDANPKLMEAVERSMPNWK